MNDIPFESQHDFALSIKPIQVLEERNYWFVRTEGGDYFETFFNNGFIGINWNEIGLYDLNHLTEAAIKAKIQRTEGIQELSRKAKSKVTGIYNKLLRFKNLKKDDVVIIPSPASGTLAIGIVQDTGIYIEEQPGDGCPFNKRRRVEWKIQKPMSRLHPKFIQMVHSRHAICNVNSYAEVINPEIATLYQKGDYTYYVLEVGSNGDVSVTDLSAFLKNIEDLTSKIDTSLGIEILDPIVIKLNVNSEGKVILRRMAGTTLIALASMLSSCSGDSEARGTSPKTPTETKLLEENFVELNEADTILRRIGANMHKINDL